MGWTNTFANTRCYECRRKRKIIFLSIHPFVESQVEAGKQEWREAHFYWTVRKPLSVSSKTLLFHLLLTTVTLLLLPNLILWVLVSLNPTETRRWRRTSPAKKFWWQAHFEPRILLSTKPWTSLLQPITKKWCQRLIRVEGFAAQEPPGNSLCNSSTSFAFFFLSLYKYQKELYMIPGFRILHLCISKFHNFKSADAQYFCFTYLVQSQILNIFLPFFSKKKLLVFIVVCFLLLFNSRKCKFLFVFVGGAQDWSFMLRA